MTDDSLNDVDNKILAIQFKAATDSVSKAQYCVVCDTNYAGAWRCPKCYPVGTGFESSVGSKKLNPIDVEKMAASEQSVYAKEIWNAAIEAAAELLDAHNLEIKIIDGSEIRKLKK